MTPDFSRQGGLVPAIVQDADSLRVLMLGYMDAAAVEATRRTGRVTFFSRSRNAPWTKGETSGHVLHFVDMRLDCDRDALLVLARPAGPTCHAGTASCFIDAPADPLAELGRRLMDRARDRPPGSYSVRLLDAGIRRIAQKVGEEGVETALAAVACGDDEFLGEAADLVFHLLVLLQARGCSLRDVTGVLAARNRVDGQGGG
jgi:phosphoribosyl-ATP pyrophosphohydrolase/phosphoribosyl-AMP cyclohydrolase